MKTIRSGHGLGVKIVMLAVIILLLTIANGLAPVGVFHLPGVAPVNFCEEDKITESCKSEVSLYVNRLDSEESAIPYEYNHFDFCKVLTEDSPVENFGQVVFGERIRPSP